MSIDYYLTEQAAQSQPIHQIFSLSKTVALIMRVEAALAKVQARHGVIPGPAAEEICLNADPQLAPLAAIEQGYVSTQHPLLAFLHAWGAQLSEETRQWLHYGATTADIFNTVLMLQLRQAGEQMLQQMQGIAKVLIPLAREHRATPMVARTLGRHALPITFGMKLASWLAEHERSMKRLRHWLDTYNTGVLSGAVGTYAALGSEGPMLEVEVMAELGLGPPEVIEWKGSRDRYVEFATHLAIAARTYGRFAQEVFLLQGDDIGEIRERGTGMGSSTMPHKSNPTLCIAIMSRCREVSAELATLFEWMMTIYERDSSMHDGTMQRVCKTFSLVLGATASLVERLEVCPEAMKANLHRTQGHILTESLTFRLAPTMGKEKAHQLIHSLVRRAREQGLSLQQALATQPELQVALDLQPKDLEPECAYGLAVQITEAALAHMQERREA